MHAISIITALAASFAVTQGAIVTFYSDNNCQNSIGSRNVYDQSCATGTGGYQSFIITSGGGSGQRISSYSRDACGGGYDNCVSAGDVGRCISALGNGGGGSNAMGSGAGCGTV